MFITSLGSVADMDAVMETSWMAPLKLKRDSSFSSEIPSIEAPKLTRNHSLFLESSFPDMELNPISGVVDFSAAALLSRVGT